MASYPTCTMTSSVISPEEVNVKCSDESLYREKEILDIEFGYEK